MNDSVNGSNTTKSLTKSVAKSNTKYVEAFNNGCNARIEGLTISTNPHHKRLCKSLWLQWRLGWLDVHDNWGIDVRGRWEYRRVPRVDLYSEVCT